MTNLKAFEVKLIYAFMVKNIYHNEQCTVLKNAHDPYNSLILGLLSDMSLT